MPDQTDIVQGKIASLAIGGVLLYIGYKAFDSLYSPKSKRKSKKRPSQRRKSSSLKGKFSSRFLRRARATTLPMRFYKTHSSRRRRMMKAEDWVGEQLKLQELNKKQKGAKYATRSAR